MLSLSPTVNKRYTYRLFFFLATLDSDFGVINLAANETLGIEDGVGRVHGSLVLCGITKETLRSRESDV